MLKYREPNGKLVIPIYGNDSSTMMTIPIRIARKYELYHSDITYEERGDGGLFIKKGRSPALTRTFMTGKRRSCGLIIPAYLARKYELSNRDNQGAFYVVLTEEQDGILIKKLIESKMTEIAL